MSYMHHLRVAPELSEQNVPSGANRQAGDATKSSITSGRAARGHGSASCQRTGNTDQKCLESLVQTQSRYGTRVVTRPGRDTFPLLLRKWPENPGTFVSPCQERQTAQKP